MSDDFSHPFESLPPLELDFDPPSPDAWQAAATASNHDKPFDRLITKTPEGISVQPLYWAADVADIDATHTVPGKPPYTRGPTPDGYLVEPWLVAQEIGYATPAMTSEALGHDLTRGQTAIRLRLDAPSLAGQDPDTAAPGTVGRGGLSLATAADFSQAVKGADLSSTPLMLPAGTAALPLLALWTAAAREQSGDMSGIRGWLAVDPLAMLARLGNWPGSFEDAYDEMAAIAVWAAEQAPGLGAIGISSVAYHDAGANAVQELAWTMATAVAYAAALQERSIPFDQTAAQLRFEYALGGDFFMTIAKLRAARQLWAQVAGAFGGDEEAQRLTLYARTARRNKTVADATNNMLRVTTEALAGAAGGVDALTIDPFDQPLGPPSDFSRRIARNVHIILRDEARLRHLIDPGGGSGAVETLTAQLAEEAWAAFQAIEAHGGMAQALETGLIQAALAQTAAEQQAAVARRQRVLVGVNQFAVIDEPSPTTDDTDYTAVYKQRTADLAAHRATRADPGPVLDTVVELARAGVGSRVELVEAAMTAAAAGATLRELTAAIQADWRPVSVESIAPLRLSAPFEALRQTARELGEATGQRPQIFLATMGPLRQHKARADFTLDFYHAGGFAMTGGAPYATPEAAVAAWQTAPTPAVVICSTDDTYPELVPQLVAQFKAAAPDTQVIMAGYPKDQIDQYEASGVDGFIYLGADCLAANERLMAHYKQGVA